MGFEINCIRWRGGIKTLGRGVPLLVSEVQARNIDLMSQVGSEIDCTRWPSVVEVQEWSIDLRNIAGSEIDSIG